MALRVLEVKATLSGRCVTVGDEGKEKGALGVKRVISDMRNMVAGFILVR